VGLPHDGTLKVHPRAIPAWQRFPAAISAHKHANPCGAAVADDLVMAYVRALECDPTSAFGGIVAINGAVDATLAEAMRTVENTLWSAETASSAGRTQDVIHARKRLAVKRSTKTFGLTTRSRSRTLQPQSPETQAAAGAQSPLGDGSSTTATGRTALCASSLQLSCSEVAELAIEMLTRGGLMNEVPPLDVSDNCSLPARALGGVDNRLDRAL